MKLPRYFTTEKRVGETPLQALDRLRIERKLPKTVPLAYAGRLDPMASGTLLILAGEECKVQEKYHTLDKEYVFEVLLGVSSDTHDVLGITKGTTPTHPDTKEVETVLRELVGTITLPYPHFSSKTVKGKPLHTWTLEGKLDCIEIPKKTSRIYSLTLEGIRTIDTQTLMREVNEKINSVETVTDARKALGRDFRRVDVRASWDTVSRSYPDETYTILTLRCVASSGTYMRTLASVIGERLGTIGLAYAIHRTRIGCFLPLPILKGFFIKTF
jgi:tRNA pseudouridine(55) synthase